MIPLIAGVTLRQVGRQRRMTMLILLGLVPVLISLLFRLTVEPIGNDYIQFSTGILATFVVPLVLPLTALLIGTSVLGQDIEEGTVAYLLAKPLARWKVIVAKVIAGWCLTYAVVLLSIVGSGGIVLFGEDAISMVPAFVIASAGGSLAYIVVFVALSLRFSRSLIIGLAYVFVWEALLAQFISGVRFLSVSAYTVGIADGLTDVEMEILDGTLAFVPAVILLVVLVAVGTWYSVRALTRYQIAERV